jgi:hypothetical protein
MSHNSYTEAAEQRQRTREIVILVVGYGHTSLFIPGMK